VTGIFRTILLEVAAGLLLAATILLAGEPADTAANRLDRKAIVDSVLARFDELYVYPKKTTEMRNYVEDKLKNGRYDEFDELSRFATQLSQDLITVSQDRHIAVYRASNYPYLAADGDTLTTADVARRARANFGFGEVKRLTGNIGYLRFDRFEHPSIAAPTASAAIAFLANCDAVIIDLRENGGGEEEMVQFLLSHFFREPTHLINVYDKDSNLLSQSWTYACVPGKALYDTELYVLISRRTASGAEAFSYDLKCYRRATLVGETTKGMAHQIKILDLPQYDLRLHVPYARPASPITNASWEKTGVTPDIEVPSARALGVAHLEACKRLIEKSADEDARRDLEWDMTAIKARVDPIMLSQSNMAVYTGQYAGGTYAIHIKDSRLYWRYSDGVDYVLIPLTADLFGFDDTDDVRLQIVRDASGKVNGFRLVYRDDGDGPVRVRTGDI